MENNNSARPWSEKINFIIAVCAVLISAASFYATYLQAESSEKQVKAMTLPLLDFEHSNWDTKTNSYRLQLKITNAGAGPAILHRAEFEYQGKQFADLRAIIKACCQESYSDFLATSDVAKRRYTVNAPLQNAILPGLQELTFFEVVDQDNSHPFWQQFETVRFAINAKLCYCSLLGDCYQSQGITNVVEVEQCAE